MKMAVQSKGEIVLMADGTPSGVLVDEAADLLLGTVPESDASTKRLALIEGEKDLFAAGLTTVTDAGLDVSDIKLISELHSSGDLQIRVMAMASGTYPKPRFSFRNGSVENRSSSCRIHQVLHGRRPGSRGAALLNRIRIGPTIVVT